MLTYFSRLILSLGLVTINCLSTTAFIYFLLLFPRPPDRVRLSRSPKKRTVSLPLNSQPLHAAFATAGETAGENFSRRRISANEDSLTLNEVLDDLADCRIELIELHHTIKQVGRLLFFPRNISLLVAF